jgi:MFS family permease
MLTGEFRKLWAGQTISAVGSSITYVALPLTAALVLGADAQQMGVLVAAGWLPFLLFALFAGVWSDRLPRKPLLIATDLARAALLATIPLAAVLGILGIEQVIVVAFLVGSMTVLFQAAYRPFIPVLVGREVLVEANSKLAMSESTARVVGPSLGGALVQLYLGGVHGRVITKSHYGHNSRERAEKWGVSGEADWGALAKLSAKVQYHIRKRLAVDRVPGRPILAGARKLWNEGYELRESASSPYRWGRKGLEPGGGPNTRPA